MAQVDIPTVATKSGEENLECVMKIRAKLFRWRDEQWKERGIGNAKLMRDRAEKQIRFVMRQEKTLKPGANFISKCQVNTTFAAKLLTETALIL